MQFLHPLNPCLHPCCWLANGVKNLNKQPLNHWGQILGKKGWLYLEMKWTAKLKVCKPYCAIFMQLVRFHKPSLSVIWLAIRYLWDSPIEVHLERFCFQECVMIQKARIVLGIVKFCCWLKDLTGWETIHSCLSLRVSQHEYQTVLTLLF